MATMTRLFPTESVKDVPQTPLDLACRCPGPEGFDPTYWRCTSRADAEDGFCAFCRGKDGERHLGGPWLASPGLGHMRADQCSMTLLEPKAVSGVPLKCTHSGYREGHW